MEAVIPAEEGKMLLGEDPLSKTNNSGLAIELQRASSTTSMMNPQSIAPGTPYAMDSEMGDSPTKLNKINQP